MPIDGVEVMNDKGELEDLKMEHATITKAVMTLSMLLNTFKSDVFEIHFQGHDFNDYICGNRDAAIGKVLLKILSDDVLNAEVTEAHIDIYEACSDISGITVTIDYDPDKE